MECIDALAEGINDFSGGLLLVSHDFRLISQVAKEISLLFLFLFLILFLFILLFFTNALLTVLRYGCAITTP